MHGATKLQNARCKDKYFFFIFMVFCFAYFVITTKKMQLFLVYLFLKGSTCFERFLSPSPAAHNCTHSLRYCQPILLPAGIGGEMEIVVRTVRVFKPSHKSVFLNRWAAARYRGAASIIPGRERFSWNS